MDNWEEVWLRKGNTDSSDLRWLNGYEDTQADGEKIVESIVKELDILPYHRVLEVGCGAGYLAQFISKKCHYTGIDRSESLVKKHIELLGNEVCVAEANSIPYKNKSFDRVFCHGVFHYFPSHEYVRDVLAEINRVSKGSIFISDLPVKSKRDSHLLFSPSMFSGSIRISVGLYEPHVRNRFNVLFYRKN